MTHKEKSPWPIGPRTLGPRTLSSWHLKSLGPWGHGPEVRGMLGPRPLRSLGLWVQNRRLGHTDTDFMENPHWVSVNNAPLLKLITSSDSLEYQLIFRY